MKQSTPSGMGQQSLAEDPILRQVQQVMLYIMVEVDAICRKHNIAYWLDAGTLLGAIRHHGFVPWDDDADVAMLREDFEHFLRIVGDELPEDLAAESFLLEGGNRTLTRIRYLPSNVREGGLVDGEHIFIDISPFDRYTDNGKPPLLIFGLPLFMFYEDALIRWKGPGEYPGVHGWKRVLYKAAVPFFRPVANRDPEWFAHWCRKKLPSVVRKIHMKPTVQIGYGFELPYRRFHYAIDQIFPLQTAEFEGYSFPVPHDCDGVLTLLYGDYMTPPPAEQRQTHMHQIDIHKMPVMRPPYQSDSADAPERKEQGSMNAF